MSQTATANTTPERRVRTEVISAEPVEALAALFDLDLPHEAGDPLPPLWHWCHLLDRRRQSDIGPDGHPTSGFPAPPGPGRRRMFAGGRITTVRPLRIGLAATRTTSIAKTVDKDGRTGPLTFVTVRHEFVQDGELAVLEEQDIVYRVPGTGALPTPPTPPAPPPGPTLQLAADEVLLFRFSALTYNAHRIHYDLGWARHEAYDGLVVHGPLQSLLMAELMRREGIDLTGSTFAYRLVSPMVGTQTLTIVPGPEGLRAGAEARSAAGAICAVSSVQPAG